MPKLAALLAAGCRARPVPAVSYASAGRCLVVGQADRAARAAAMLAEGLDVLLVDPWRALPQLRTFPVHAGRPSSCPAGSVRSTSNGSTNPIDPDRCTRCNACIAVCEGAIDFGYQVDLVGKCTGSASALVGRPADRFRGGPQVEPSGSTCLDSKRRRRSPSISLRRLLPCRLDAALVDAKRVCASVGEFEKPHFSTTARSCSRTAAKTSAAPPARRLDSSDGAEGQAVGKSRGATREEHAGSGRGRHRRRAALVRRLRRVLDGVPDRRAPYPTPDRPTSAARCGRCCGLRGRPGQDAALLIHSRKPAAVVAASGAPRARTRAEGGAFPSRPTPLGTGDDYDRGRLPFTALRVCCRSRSGTRRSSASISGCRRSPPRREPGLGAVHPRGERRSTGRRLAVTNCAGDPERSGVRRRFPFGGLG